MIIIENQFSFLLEYIIYQMQQSELEILVSYHFMESIRKNDFQSIKAYIKLGIDINTIYLKIIHFPGIIGPALHIAVRYNASDEILNYLFEKGANINLLVLNG